MSVKSTGQHLGISFSSIKVQIFFSNITNCGLSTLQEVTRFIIKSIISGI